MRDCAGSLSLCFVALAACSSPASNERDGGALVLTPVDGRVAADDASVADATTRRDGGVGEGSAPDAEAETAPNRCASGSDRFIKEVVSFDPGACAGYGASSLPGVVCGPPEGGGTSQDSTDVVSLGNGGSIVVGFGANAIVDGDGGDFIVFENPFVLSGSSSVFAEPGEVSVSEDGVHWSVFPCTDLTQAPPYGECAGVKPVLSNPNNGISPFDVDAAGGDVYDLAKVGLTKAKFVRVRDVVVEACPDGGVPIGKNGFDLDAIAIVHPLLP